MLKDLKNLFIHHKGKYSDKWSFYLNEWDKLFLPYRQANINLLEIGVHNGGSLEIWAKYFQNAKHLIGCDIDEACHKLHFDDSRISVLIGDVNSDHIEQAIVDITPGLDIIIDDGSHQSGDIIRAFSRYFKYLNPNGIYIIEDLHASYWDDYNGGLHAPYASMSFFKRLVDITNYEHWRIAQSRLNYLLPFIHVYDLNLSEFDLNMIHAIEFMNSLCVIHKRAPEENNLGRRMITGLLEVVSQDWRKLDGISIHDIAAKIKDYSSYDLYSLINQNTDLRQKTQALELTVENLKQDIEKGEGITQQLRNDLLAFEQSIQQQQADLHAREKRIDQLESDLIRQEKIIRQLKMDLGGRDTVIHQLRFQLENDERLIRELETDISQQNQDLMVCDVKLNDYQQIIKNQNKKIVEQEAELLSYALKEKWWKSNILNKLKKLFSVKGFFKNLYQYLRIKRSGLFDSRYYLQTYPDVRKAKFDPLMHFIRYGWREGRNPNSRFNTLAYLSFHPDVERNGLNPLLHFMKHGEEDGSYLKHFNFKGEQFSHIDLSSSESRRVGILFNSNFPPTSPDIILFPIIDWDFRFQRPQQITSRLAKLGHRIFYIRTTFCDGDGPVIKAIAKNIYTVQLSSRYASASIYDSLPARTLKDLESSIKLLRDHFLINSAIVMVNLPSWGELANRLKKSYGWKLIYDCMDLHMGFSNSSPFMRKAEQNLLKTSDLVFATSRTLYNHAINQNDQTLLIPNGTDFEFFSQAQKQTKIEEITHISKPILGYYGAIADWFDTSLVGALARDHSEWHFLLIGSTELADLEPLDDLANITLLGEKPYSELPEFLSYFDVCLIPFKQIPLTQATNPVKLYEYLSAGKPVVGTRLNELSYYHEYVRLAETKEEWAKAIQQSLAEGKDPIFIKKHLAFARENTWDKRVELVESELSKLFPKISIIIVTFNNLELTKMCLTSVFENTGYPNYEIILVDNGSNRDTQEFIQSFALKYQNVKYQLNNENLGFAKAANQGFQESSGDFIVFLNDDTIVSPGWLDRLRLHLEHNPLAGMVGPVTNAIGNEAKVDVSYTHLDDINAYAAFRAKDFSSQAFEINVLALYCCMISRETFASVGGLDERYNIGMFEDDDLAMKVKQKGFKLLCAEDVFIHHFHGASLKKLSNEAYQKLFDENKRKYEEKWGTEWQPHRYRP